MTDDARFVCQTCGADWPKEESAEWCCKRRSPIELQMIKVLQELRTAVEMADSLAIHPKFQAAGIIYSAMAKLTEDTRMWADDALLSYIEAKQPDPEEWGEWLTVNQATSHRGIDGRIWHGHWKDRRSGNPPKPWPNSRSVAAALKRAQQLRQRYGREAMEEWEADWCSKQTGDDYHVAKYGGWWAVFTGPFTGMHPSTDEENAWDRKMRQPVAFPDNPVDHSDGRAVFNTLAQARQYIEELHRGDRALPAPIQATINGDQDA